MPAWDLTPVGAILMGISLAACAGLRAFLPLLTAGIAVRAGWWPVEGWYGWVGSNEALLVFGIATVAEIMADKIPVVDHALDVFYTVARPAAGALVAIGAFSQLSPTYAVAAGIIVGAPIAGGLHLAKAGTRVASTSLTAGAGNPILSFVEDLIAFLGVILAVVAPLVAVLGLTAAVVMLRRWIRARRARQRANLA
ncbi:MAG: DUF4126 domain-containing protein [Armatimonadota bacterium]